MKDEKGREMGVAVREVGGRMAAPWAPEKAEGVRENLQRAPGWRNLSILQFEGSCCMGSNEGFSCIETILVLHTSNLEHPFRPYTT